MNICDILIRCVRVRCDVQDLNLSAVDVCLNAPVSIVGKHLCGGCTDLSMRANCHWNNQLQCQPGLCSLCDPAATAAAPSHAPTPASIALQQAWVDAFLVATCCHHRLTWEVFAGQQQWLQLGFSRADFDTARRLSAWHNLWGAACVAAEHGGGSREQRSFDWMRSVGRAAKDVFDSCR
jgi:tRNA:m4X modification enzyme